MKVPTKPEQDHIVDTLQVYTESRIAATAGEFVTLQ